MQIEEFLTANGFVTVVKTANGLCASKGDLSVIDIHGDNAIVVDGQVRVIDCQIFQNK